MSQARVTLVSLAAVHLLVETARVTGLDTGLSAGLESWQARPATHDPGTVLVHLAMGLAAGADCPADVAFDPTRPTPRPPDPRPEGPPEVNQAKQGENHEPVRTTRRMRPSRTVVRT